MKLVGMMIVHNEADRYLRRVLDRATCICDVMVILDDHSTDNTVEVCREYYNVIVKSAVNGWACEWKLREELLQFALEQQPDYVMSIDADEVIETYAIQEFRDLIAAGHQVIQSQILDMWTPTHYRADKHFRNITRTYVVSAHLLIGAAWKKTNRHCGSFPRLRHDAPACLSTSRVVHYGWVRLSDKINKVAARVKEDPEYKMCPKEIYDAIADENPTLVEYVPTPSSYTVLVGVVVRKMPDILRPFLESLTRVVTHSPVGRIVVIDDNTNAESTRLLTAWARRHAATYIRNDDVQPDDGDHAWRQDKERNVWKVAALKNRLFEFLTIDFTHIFLIDADILVHPRIVEHMLSAKKDWICQVFLTDWARNGRTGLNVWEYDENKLSQVFYDQWTAPMVAPVGMGGACTLISRAVIDAGVDFSKISNLTMWGEDRHFCIKAAGLGFQLYGTSVYPALHLYRPSDLAKVHGFVTQLGITSERPQFSILIPFASDGGQREKVYQWLVRYYQEHLPEAEVVTHPVAVSDLLKLNRSALRNDIVRHATTDALLILDADCLLPPDYIRAMMGNISHESAPTLYQAALLGCVSKNATSRIIAASDGVVREADIEKYEMNPVGLFFAMSRRTWDAIGGFNEAYVGWGAEDSEYVLVARSKGIPVERVPGNTYHLWHDRGVHDNKNCDTFRVNRERYEALKRQLSAAPPTVVQHGKVHCLASEPHYADHLLPVYVALPQERRGEFFVAAGPPSARVLGLLQRAKLPWKPASEIVKAAPGPVLVSSMKDAKIASAAGRAVVLMQHGAGQSYGVPNESYAGGSNRVGVVMELCPNPGVAQKNQAAHPDIPNVVIGSPRVDWLSTIQKVSSARPVVCLSFHWDCQLTPETRSAWDAYATNLSSVLGQEFEVIGHAHPRMLETVRPIYQRYGIPVVEDFAEVVRRADVYVVDNSSTLFEFAALDRPVVLLNAPWYRKGVTHGMRFWEYAGIGVQCDRAGDLLAAIRQALTDPEPYRTRRREVSAVLYPYRDEAAQRAVQAILTTEACWHAPLPQTIRKEPTMVRLRANYQFCHGGRIVERDQEIVVNDREARRLMATMPTGRTKPCASLVEDEVPAPPVTPAEGGVIHKVRCNKCDLDFETRADYMRHIRTHGKTEARADTLDTGEKVDPLAV